MTHVVTTCTSLGLAPHVAEKLNDFAILFLKWNSSINLSAAKNVKEIEEHIIDSLHVIPHLPDAGRVLDVGSGGGFPVVVAAVCLPMLNFTALEPVHKKHAFLRTAARELELVNLEAYAVRVEDHDEHDYDATTSRATLDLVDWMTLGRSMVRPGGLVLGFEAVEREGLPAPFERHAYSLAGKARAIIVGRRPA